MIRLIDGFWAAARAAGHAKEAMDGLSESLRNLGATMKINRAVRIARLLFGWAKQS